MCHVISRCVLECACNRDAQAASNCDMLQRIVTHAQIGARCLDESTQMREGGRRGFEFF